MSCDLVWYPELVEWLDQQLEEGKVYWLFVDGPYGPLYEVIMGDRQWILDRVNRDLLGPHGVDLGQARTWRLLKMSDHPMASLTTTPSVREPEIYTAKTLEPEVINKGFATFGDMWRTVMYVLFGRT